LFCGLEMNFRVIFFLSISVSVFLELGFNGCFFTGGWI
jgi:hypothetical protein